MRAVEVMAEAICKTSYNGTNIWEVEELRGHYRKLAQAALNDLAAAGYPIPMADPWEGTYSYRRPDMPQEGCIKYAHHANAPGYAGHGNDGWLGDAD